MCSTVDSASIASRPGKFLPRSMALTAARESCQGDSLVRPATSAWVRRWACRVERRKAPTLIWAASRSDRGIGSGLFRRFDSLVTRDRCRRVEGRSATCKTPGNSAYDVPWTRRNSIAPSPPMSIPPSSIMRGRFPNPGCRVAPGRCLPGALTRSGLGDFHHPAPPWMCLACVTDPRSGS